MKNILFNSLFEGQGTIVKHDQDNNRLEVWFKNIQTIPAHVLQTVIEICINTPDIESYFIYAPEVSLEPIQTIQQAIDPLRRKVALISKLETASHSIQVRFISPVNEVVDFQRALEFISAGWDFEEEKPTIKEKDINEVLEENLTESFPELLGVENQSGYQAELVSIEEGSKGFDEELYQRRREKNQNLYDLD